ncbi:hypothetical protein SPHI_19040 [Sphingomonas jeddahensis]|uniref:Uncharacterized protein n=1 Tax=Sphingomonas jeddahensis TaxID=1915074 RepID=A0A1V2EU12_9SPHN|nr:hypothetical protein SPHI_19040 [Sphingomonas jeddahensis]
MWPARSEPIVASSSPRASAAIVEQSAVTATRELNAAAMRDTVAVACRLPQSRLLLVLREGATLTSHAFNGRSPLNLSAKCKRSPSPPPETFTASGCGAAIGCATHCPGRSLASRSGLQFRPGPPIRAASTSAATRCGCAQSRWPFGGAIPAARDHRRAPNTFAPGWVVQSETPLSTSRWCSQGYSYGWFPSEVRGDPTRVALGPGGWMVYVLPDWHHSGCTVQRRLTLDRHGCFIRLARLSCLQSSRHANLTAGKWSGRQDGNNWPALTQD